MNMWQRLRSYLNLTKPSILLLVGLTGATGLVLEKSLLDEPVKFILVLVGLLLAGGSANAFNQYFERDRDALMERTRSKRPLPLHELKPSEALSFSIIVGILSTSIFAYFFNWMSAFLALGTILFYGLFYTLWLKPRTHLNIVIGGAAGAMAPVIAWAAAAGGLHWIPLVLFLIIFLWTPPHFWALALCLKEDYRKVGLPMLPIVKGDEITTRQILHYSWWTVLTSLTLGLAGVGVIYVISAVLLGTIFLIKAMKLKKRMVVNEAGKLFGFSIIYLLALFVALMLDSLVKVKL
jgi:protoheme IX farnesyltransferase